MTSIGVSAGSLSRREVLRGATLDRPIQAVQGLDEARFRQLFREERDRTFGYLLRLTGRRADAEDLLQETFLTVWRKRDQFEGRGSLAGFLRRTAFRLFLNHKERNRRRRELAPAPEPERHEPAAVRGVARKDAVGFLMQRVQEQLAELPEPAREAFLLFRFEGLTCSAIADLTDTPVKTIESRVRRATQLLAASLSRYQEHVPD